MISEKTHPELARALNNMTTVINREHTDREWKQSLMRVLSAFAVEIIHPIIPIVTNGFAPDRSVMNQIIENHKYGSVRHFKDPNIHLCDKPEPPDEVLRDRMASEKYC